MLNLIEAVDRLGVSTRTVCRLVERGELISVRAARAKAGLAHIEPAISTHDLRHYCLTHLAHNTNQLREIMKFAGHSSTAAALRYQHAAASDLRHLAGEIPS